MSLEGFRASFEPRGPDHFNKIINQPVSFIDEEGSAIRTNVYEAARSAEAVAAKLQERVIIHYKKSKGFDWYGYQVCSTKAKVEREYFDDRRQYNKLGELLERINAVVMLLEQDKGAFRLEAVPSSISLVISTADDIERVSKELKGIAEKIKVSYLTSSSKCWRLPDYMKALNGMWKI